MHSAQGVSVINQPGGEDMHSTVARKLAAISSARARADELGRRRRALEERLKNLRSEFEERRQFAKRRAHWNERATARQQCVAKGMGWDGMGCQRPPHMR